MIRTLTDDLNLQINADYAIQRFGEAVYLYNTKKGFEKADLNPVETDIMLTLNTVHRLGAVWEILRKKYQIPESDKEAKNLFCTFVSNTCQKGVFEEGNRVARVFGDAGKCYPITLTIELTNQCNFRCSHCYKEALSTNRTFLQTDFAMNLLGQIKGKVWHLDFTGGEATLHPDFEKIISVAEAPSMCLLTNGSRLTRISKDILNKFNMIQITLYGSSEEEYQKYTKTTSFEDVCKGIARLAELDVSGTVAIILRKTNVERIEEYISLLNSLGVKNIRFGLARKIGRNAKATTDWDMEYEDCCKFDEIFEEVRDKYPDIYFSDFDWRFDYNIELPIKNQYSIGCQAGIRNIVVSERARVRPCIMMPAEYFEYKSWDEYQSIIDSGKLVNWDSCVADCVEAFSREGRTIDSICSHAFV